jgi:hypothetical protein
VIQCHHRTRDARPTHIGPTANGFAVADVLHTVLAGGREKNGPQSLSRRSELQSASIKPIALGQPSERHLCGKMCIIQAVRVDHERAAKRALGRSELSATRLTLP